MLGCSQILRTRLFNHDRTKIFEPEFEAYARWFYGPRDNPTEWAEAFQHHIHTNDHHPEYWQYLGKWAPSQADIQNGCLPMPEDAVTEMVCDWLGASYAYTQSWDITRWLIENLPKTRLHPRSAAVARALLEQAGYTAILLETRFAGEER
jgi:hypothetical protein